jgi:phenylalanyl-tRNA synthetase alpha chain
MITYTKNEDTIYQLKPEGVKISQEGSHEARFWAILPPAGTGQSFSDQEIVSRLGNEVAKVGRNQALKMGWARREGNVYVQAVSPRS